jgi:hypothetical protein
MSALSIQGVVRSILSADISMAADEVIKKAKAKGLTASEASIRSSVHNVRSELRRSGGKGPSPKATVPKVMSPKAVVPKATITPKPSVAMSAAAPAPDLTGLLANITLVNQVVGAAGGVDPARQVAEAVRACGGVEAFLMHLDTVAGIRGTPAH